MIKTIKLVAIGFLLGIVISAIGYFVYQKKVFDPQIAASKAAYDKLKSDADTYKKGREQAEAENQKIIAAKDSEILTLRANQGKPTQAEKDKDAEIASLQADVAKYKASGDLAKALEASEAQNKAWAEKFSLAEKRNKEAFDALDAAWVTKYAALEDTSKKRLEELTKRDAQIEECEKKASLLERKSLNIRDDRRADFIAEIGISAYSAIANRDLIPFGICVAKEVSTLTIRVIRKIF